LFDIPVLSLSNDLRQLDFAVIGPTRRVSTASFASHYSVIRTKVTAPCFAKSKRSFKTRNSKILEAKCHLVVLTLGRNKVIQSRV